MYLSTDQTDKLTDLSGDWKLTLMTHAEFSRRAKAGESVPLIASTGQAGELDARVPGNIEDDLMRAGLMPDMFYGMNILKTQELEDKHVFYSRSFTISPEQAARELFLRFEGIDTFADIYLNGEKLGETDNMFIPFVFPIRAAAGVNSVLVHITPLTVGARRYDNSMLQRSQVIGADTIQARKAPYMLGWDIFHRSVSAGLWRPVSLEAKKPVSFRQSYLYTRGVAQDKSSAELSWFYDLDLGDDSGLGLTAVIEGECGESRFCSSIRVFGSFGTINLRLPQPKLWWPRGRGEQHLYECSAKLMRDDEIIAEKRFSAGIRTIELDRTSVTDENGSGEFCFRVNGEKIFILGTNWVPLDQLPSRNKAKIARAMALVTDVGCNMIRVWGGGVYEDPELYDICDREGVLVWQDFMMACGIYPQDDEFLKRLEPEIVYIARLYRQHASLALWSGDNEDDDAFYWNFGGKLNPNINRTTRELIARVLTREDYIRSYIPSSPYIDEELHKKGRKYATEDHLWGPRDYFKSDFYQKSLAHFASETGYHGCPSPASVAKFISPHALWPWQNNDEWLLHACCQWLDDENPCSFAYRIKLMASQIEVLFGEQPDSLERFALLSQISQAEAKKFFIERFRFGKWRRTGLIWWNILDGCPQFSDAVVDYYFTRKLAYHYIKRSQAPITLLFREPEKSGAPAELVICNDTRADVRVNYTVRNLVDDRIVAEGIAQSEPDAASTVASVASPDGFAFYRIDWTLGDGTRGMNHYVPTGAPYSADMYIDCAKKCGILELEGF